MTKRIHAMLALAASATMGAGVVLAANPADQPPLESHSAREAAAPVGPGSTATPDEAMHSDQLIAMQLSAISQDPTTAPDKLFILNSAIDSMDEVRLSQTIADRTNDQQLKMLATHMISDHQALNSKLAQTAQELGVQLPQTLPSMKNEEAKIFAALPDKVIEQQYLADMNAGHAKAIACFEGAATLSQNPRVRQLATDTLPTLHEHRKMVMQVASSMGINFHENTEAMPAGAELRGSGNSDASNPNNDVNNSIDNGKNPNGVLPQSTSPQTNSPAQNSSQAEHTTDKNGR